ncbi:hypothetical protein [Phaeobacter gallaeciensis]|uniref:Uncharacterized protein n=1 Tax=Phaeobacter gallaeciensis TaxID=60890 RepID=A0AAC9Z9Q2_9RHOB|nr:hypothetical protein [Phaeobacter gallaeciensis]AHD09166.1 hypothetical protein Gal_01404 [Phaeobacter gallaeciensis DSM 26640]ATE92429.1 hypothetical protein PhaeoP11_01395 [Phaeobacter gallaeciensis]ATE97749.1 hypothetical protein PhaeoP73_02451 [Phaeobacter gallaeciensis]ATF01094.1 hypothetical protein PhaeoP75_01445 [Phaeobacter gallaeciensis]ATF05474.1 hypothetical protein PhaeoP63_01393 [Phaeobacter gallaeciensis]
MSPHFPIAGIIPLDGAAPELSYPGLSPQLLARVRQLWSAAGLDFDHSWRVGLRSLPGFRALPRIEAAPASTDVDLVFLYDQAVLWVRALHEAAAIGRQVQTGELTADQWHGLAALSARLTEQLAALRLLALTDLPMPAMQIARSLSEDVDMALVILIRRKLAERFAACRSAEEASDFWRRHIAGGRAFRTISEKLYAVGIDYSADTDYAKWRKSVLTTLGAAVHSNVLKTEAPRRQPGTVMMNGDSLHFATFRIHELCAFAQLLEPDLTNALETAANSAPSPNPLAGLAAPMSAIIVNQIQSLSAPPSNSSKAAKHH